MQVRSLFLSVGGLALAAFLSGCAHTPPLPVVAEDDAPQFHPQPPILGPNGKPLHPPGFYDEHGRLVERVLDPALRDWMWYMNTNMAAGHREYADAVGYVKGLDALLARHHGERTVAAEQILRAKADFYFEVWDDAENGSRLYHQLMREYPDTPFGRELIRQHKGHGQPDPFDQPVEPLE